MTGRAAAARWARLAQPYFWLHRHSGMEKVLGILARREANADGQALNHLDIVAGRILRRQQAEAIAARAREILDIALVVAAERVGRE